MNGSSVQQVFVNEIREGYELTAQQEQVWLRGGDVWLWGAMRVAGELEVERVQRVVRELAAAEEVLRSGFARLAGMDQPLQVLRDESAVVVELEECEAVAVAELIKQWGRGGKWDEAGEQWSVKLWRVGGESVLGVRMTPLCGDRETVQSVIEEVLSGYVGEREAQQRVQYADYGAWQKEGREEGTEGRAYWERDQQRAFGRELRLGLERGGVGEEWRRQRVMVASEVAEQVRRVAAAEEVSVAAVLLSVWQLLLWRHTEAEVVEVESYFDGRKYEDLRNSLGRYGRYLPISFRFEKDFGFIEVVRWIEESISSASLYQDCWRETGLGSSEIGFEYVSWARKCEWLEERVGGQKLKLCVEREAERLWVELAYDDGVLSEAAAEWLSEQYVQLLSEVSGAPEQVVSEAVLVSAREQAQVLGWNEPRINTDDRDQAGAESEIERSVVQLFEARVAQRPEAIAIGCGVTQLSFGELNRRANQLAHYLRAQGVGPEVVVGLCVERSVEMVVGLLGILKAGGAYLPLDPNYPRPRLEYLLGDAQVQLVLTQQRLLERLPVLGRAIALDQEWETIAAESTENLLPVTEAENLAYVIYTSGSTGQPKGVMISHGNLWQLLHGLKETVYAELGKEPLRVGWNASLSFDASVKQWAQLLNGHAVYLLDEEERLEAARVLEYVRRHGVQVLDTTPGQLRTWLEAGLKIGAGGQLAAVLVGGEAIDEQLWQELGALERPVFYNVYGPTECTVDATWSAVRGERPVLGQRLPHVSVYVLDEQLRLAPVGVRGELCIGGGGVGRGYWQRAELTAERYVPHPYSTVGGERLYRSGDEGRYLEDGTIEYLGRRDQQVKVRGYRIELGEIEAVLESHAAVRQAVVTVRDEQQLVAYLVARRGVQLHETNVGERSEGYEVSAGLRVAQQNKNETDYLYHEIFERRCYLQHGVSIERGDWVVDVGANIGLFSLQAAQLGAARVYAFEPLGPVCASLRQNARLGGGRIRVFEHGLSHEEEEAQFTYYPRYTMMSGQSEYADAAGEVEVIKRYLENEASGGSADAASLLKDADELLAGRFTGQVQQCRLRRLTDVLREEQVRRVDLLKIDVQRAEWDVLQGLETEDWERIGQVVLEVHDWEGGRGRAAEIRELLQEKGYEVTVAQDELLVGTDRFNVYGVRRGYRENGRSHVVELEEEDWTSGGEWEVSEVREHARERLPEYMVPQRWVVLEQMPLTAHGKVDRERLPAPASERAAEREAEGEWTPVEELVAGIWSEVLKQTIVSRSESFFELGGHSLLATQVISRVREVFGVEVGLRRLFEEPTLGGFSRSIEEELRAGAGVTVPKLQRLGATEREQWGGLMPLSFAQQRLWFLNQLAPESEFYNSFNVVRLKGTLHVEALERTLSEIVRRHEVLRTRFVNVGGEPRQEVLETAPFKLALTDFSSLSEAEREAAVREAARVERREPFDLATGPMLRVKLLRLGDEEHVVLLTMHHIVSDAWSVGVLIREVATLYEAYSQGVAESPLPELPIQYADFAVWQRGWLRDEELERQLAYWRRQLGGDLPPLELPIDRERPALPSYSGAQLNFRLSAEVSAGLKELSRREGVTLFMTLLAAFETLLHRHSGQQEIVVGTVLAGRTYRETESLIGFFLNTLALRTDLSGEPTFVELLQRVKEVCLGAYAHQDLPFEKLVEELQPERDLSRSPLFQVAFGLQNVPQTAARLGELELQAVNVASESVRYDLTLWLTEGSESLGLWWSYRDELFSAERIEWLQGRFERLLEEIVAEPEWRLSQFAVESREEEAEREAREVERRAALETGGVAELVVVEEVEGYELTGQQEQVWQRGGESWLWGVVRVAGELEVERVQRVVRELAATEEVLRSGFARLAGMEQPLQVLRGESAVVVEVGEVVDDVEHWGRGGEWEESGEQWSVKLWRVGEETVLAVRMSPLSGDRETVRSLIEEVLSGYERELLGMEQGEMPRRVQYADYGAWQKEVREEEGAEGKAYWEREQHSSGERELRLGLERGAVGGAWRQHRVTVTSEVVEQVRRVAESEEVSEAAVLLSVWQLLLSRHTEAEVVTVDSRVGGRGYEELQGAFGRYERWVPVQVRVRAEASWRELLRESAARLAEAEQWQEYFSGAGAGTVAGAGERIGFEYVSWARQWMGAELQARWERLEERVGGQKLKLRGESDASGLSIQLEYDAAVLSEAAAEWLSEQYVQLLSEISCSPAQLVSEAVLVSAREQAQVLGWNEPRINTDDTDQATERDEATNRDERRAESEIKRSVVQLFEAQVAQRPEAIAIGCGAAQLSFGELNRRANQLAHYLRAQGVGPEVVVGLCLERSVELVVGLLGILKAGGAYLPLDPNYPRPRLEYLLGDAQAHLVLTQQRLLERLPVLGRAIALDLEWEGIAAESTENPLPVTEAENLAYVIYTSGSTGQPKGAMISHGNLWQLLHGLRETVYAELGKEPLRVGWNASLSFDASVKQWAQLLNGHGVYLLDEEERLEAGRVLEYVRQHEVQVLDTTPGQLRTWLEAGLCEGGPGEQLAAVLVGGEAIDEQLWQELAALGRPVFYNVYGPTECTVDATWSAVRGERAVLGQRLPHVSVYVLDEQLRLAPVGVRGELCIGGGGVGRGYWQRAELTAERYVPHPYSTVGGERLYRTGDEGRYLEDGTIEYLGRRDQQVKVRGYRIELGEIEAVLESHAAVRQAVVTVRDEQQLVAYLVPRRGVQLHETSIGERSEGYEVSAGLRVAQQNKNETDYLYHEIFERRCYLQHEVSIERGDWVVDVGANIGLFSLQAAQLGAARIYAFEPLGPVCASLRQNARLGGGRIRVFEHGLSHEEEEAQFTYYPRYTMMSGQSEYADAAGEVEVIKRYLENEASGGSADAASLLKDADELLAGRFTGQVQQCRLRRLTDVLREEQVRRVDLLKIDVQRAEWDVLQGLAAADWERIGQVVLEVHDWEGGRGRAAEIRELLQEKGYEVTVAQDELLVGTDRFNVYGVRRGYRENGRSHVVELEEEDWTSGGEWEVSEVREYARERLPEYMVPQRWVVLEQIPLTAHGKVDRERLPAPASERAAEREAEGEWTPVEELVAGIWSEVLKQKVVSRRESFFELGGHSLLATQVISRVREVFGVEVGLRRLFEEPTLGGFSNVIDEILISEIEAMSEN